MRLLILILTRAAVFQSAAVFCAARRDASLDSDFKPARQIAILLEAKNCANRSPVSGFKKFVVLLILLLAKNCHKPNTLIDDKSLIMGR